MARRSSESWVRPPVVARELPSAALARWRYRVVALVLLALVVLLFVGLFLRFSNITGGEDPGLVGSLGRPAVSSAPAPGLSAAG